MHNNFAVVILRANFPNLSLIFKRILPLSPWQQAYKIWRLGTVILVLINMRLTTSRYCVMLIVQFGLLFADISVNCFSDFARKSSVVQLLLFM